MSGPFCLYRLYFELKYSPCICITYRHKQFFFNLWLFLLTCFKKNQSPSSNQVLIGVDFFCKAYSVPCPGWMMPCKCWKALLWRMSWGMVIGVKVAPWPCYLSLPSIWCVWRWYFNHAILLQPMPALLESCFAFQWWSQSVWVTREKGEILPMQYLMRLIYRAF